MTTTIPTNQLSAIAATYGTPVYVYDANKIKTQYEKLVNGFSVLDTRIFYASKALTNLHVIKYINSLGCNIDCSSINEVKLALHAGVKPENVLYTSNGISFAEIEEAVEAGVHINIDSLSNLEKFGKKYGHSYPVGIRLRPNIMAGGNLKISTGHNKSKFGIPVEQIAELEQIVKDNNIFIRTLHIHTGSEIKDAEVFVKGIEVLFDLIPHFPELEVIDLGGGFKVPYMEHEKETNIAELAQKLKQAFADHPLANGKELQVWFEPGKFLVSECGYLLAEVNVLKQNADVIIAGINTGLNHLIRPMMYDAYHYISNLSNPNGEEKKHMITGYICETDTFASDRMLPEIKEGDILCIHNAGAYGFEMSSNYNSRYRPAEVLVKDGEAILIRRRESFEDLLKNIV
ncbi:diaminopimelate decarboxylase [Lacibacter luteus]|uniref:diaminopimelate decarboxylase n=1 Tax=Lacibacter luteus TaxID=2508719 RepID=UPI00197B3584|nr:diaminopimelate decarboxylase [Lacibacter luteus]